MTAKDAANSGRALLIGIDKYASAPPLRGCGNDVQLMATVLPRFGFAPANIHKLINGEATRKAILARLDRLLQEAGPDEVIFLHFSGWGLRVPRQAAAGAEIALPWNAPTRDMYPSKGSWGAATKQARGSGVGSTAASADLVSAILPCDWDNTPGTSITYDEIQAWAARALGRSVIIVFDAPYAGGLTGNNVLLPAGHVFIGASRFEEICMEVQAASGVFQGALSYYLAQALIEAEPGATYRDVFLRVSASVGSRVPNQHPQFQGDADAPLFTTGHAASARIVTVKHREEDRVVLSVGAAQGATVRSQWAIYPPDVADVSPDTPRLGLAEITGVRATEADARVLSESARASIKPGVVAMEEAHYFGEMRLSVRIETPPDLQWQRDELAKLVLGSELLKLLEDPTDAEAADITVHLLLPRSAAAENDPVPQLDVIGEPTWAAVDRSSNLVFAPISTAGSGSSYEVRDKLESLSRYRNVLGLRNPNPNSPFAGKIQFTLMRKGPDKHWIRAEADRQDGLPVFHEGERLGLEIANDLSMPVWVAVVDFGFYSSVSMVYPSEGASEQIPPHGKIQLWMNPDQEMELFLSEDYLGAAADDAGEVSGVETLKLFATVYPTDLGRLLLQEGGRGIYSSQGEGTALWQLLDMALTGVGRRELKPVQLPPEQEWSAVDRAFELRRKR